MNATSPPPGTGSRHAPGPGEATPAQLERLERLEREKAMRDDILSMAAHELRNPLHALSLHLALARTLAEPAAPEAASRIRSAERTLKRYAERVTVLMDLLGSAGGAYPLTPRDVDVPALLAALAEQLEHEAGTRGFVLHVDAPAACIVRTDPVVLEQIVDNLVLNALKHSGGNRIELRCRGTPRECVVAVTDNGHGIAAEDRRAIFEKFAVATHTPRGTGSGLGLWIVARLVGALGGTMLLADAPGGGCVFETSLPRDSDETESDEERPEKRD